MISVTGSFRDIKVSFTYNGPQIIMSVANQAVEERQLRVMYQRQPLSGRVNWTAFQLSNEEQSKVVPAEVMQSHRLTFYVDDHQPISTYTEKILEDLERIREESPQVNEPDTSTTAPETARDAQQTMVNQNGESDPAGSPTLPAEQKAVAAEQTEGETDVEKYSVEEVSQITQNGQSPVAHQDTAPQSVVKTSEQPEPESSESVLDVTPKFKIKVPVIPKSGSNQKQQTTFIPPRTEAPKGDKGLFGKMRGAWQVFTSSKRNKTYYFQQNQRIQEEFLAKLAKLENNYNKGRGLPLNSWKTETLNEKQTAVLLLNLMVNELADWKKAAKPKDENSNLLAETLETLEEKLRKVLIQTRGVNAPSPTLCPNKDDAKTEQDLIAIQKDCERYIQRFSEKLAGLEQEHAEKVDVLPFKKFLVKFVKENLYANVVKHTLSSTEQERLNWFLGLIDHELMPIEVGKTKFSAKHHQAKGKHSSHFESDTIVEVISPGLQSKDGKQIIRTALVALAE